MFIHRGDINFPLFVIFIGMWVLIVFITAMRKLIRYLKRKGEK